MAVKPHVEPYHLHVFICTDPKPGGCAEKGGEEVRRRLKDELDSRGIGMEVRVTRCGSVGLCQHGPVVLVYPEGAWYAPVRPENVPEIVEEHIVNGRPVQHLLVHRLGSLSQR